jgi:hypothetical protein
MIEERSAWQKTGSARHIRGVSSALPANLCPFSGCHECEEFDGEVWSSELHSGGKLTQSKYHRKMNSTAARAAIGSIWCGGTESEIKES